MENQHTNHPSQPNEFIKVADDVQLHYRDYGSGKPVILIHGWPLSKEMWEYQIETLVQNNFRVITYDRRGFGKSSQPWNGYDYDTLTDDLKAVIDTLGLTDATIVGFSMGGGEVVRYFSRHGGENVSKAVLVSSIAPFLLKTADNPDGVPQEHNDEVAAAIRKDRIGFLDDFGKKFFSVSLLNKPLSDALMNYYTMLCSFASPRATLECAGSFATTDFREEMVTVKVPTLVIHGDDDKTVPIEISSDKAAKLIPNCEYKVYEGAPHGLFYTHKEKLNADLVAFINS